MARIRTIKPEFWSHPIMAKQDDSTKLMAIALLNYADDEGYFHAEPNIVRGFCRPFDDNSTITKKCIENLIKIEYISVCENELYGSIGLIEKFLDHQRIDRPNDSKLKCYYSSKTRRKLDDKSKTEGKGMEKEKEGNRKEFVKPTLDQIKNYFKENNYLESAAIKFFNYYEAGNWTYTNKESKTVNIKNWKQKAQAVWFTESNLIKDNLQKQAVAR